MKRCLASLTRHGLLALAVAATCGMAVIPAHAQVQGALGNARTFPDAALRGTLVITGASDATINGQAIRMAPGMRLFSPQNTLILAHQVLGQEFIVNYLIENSTGMLQSAWILSQGEARQPRAGSDTVIRNFRGEYDIQTEKAR